MRFDLTLPYDLAEGWYAPYLRGLRRGLAVAAGCGACGAVSFPPLRVCSCGGVARDWLTLPGSATVIFRTDGADGAFGLVRFDGADSRAVVGLRGIGPGVTRGRLIAADVDRPAALIGPIGGDAP